METFDEIWTKLKIKNSNDSLFIKEGEKEMMLNEDGFVIKCKVGDLR